MTVPTMRATIMRTSRARARMSAPTTTGPLPLTGPGHDDARITAWVTTHTGSRLGLLTTAHLTGKPTWPINGAATASIRGLIYDPNLAQTLRTASLKIANGESADVEIQLYRKGALLPAHWCITSAKIDLHAQTYSLELTDTTWYLQNRELGYPQPKNFLDLPHWNGQDPTDGLFDSSLSGWSTEGGATKDAVTSPAFDVFAPNTAKVTAPGTPRFLGQGITKLCDCSHSFAAGLNYRLHARNWSPSDQGTFLYEVALSLRYYPPDALSYASEATYWFPDTLYPRDTWQTLSCDLHVPPNDGGRLEAVLWAPETGYTYWGSRWGIFRRDQFTHTPYNAGERPAHAIGRLPHALKLPGDDPYRNITADGSSHAGQRVKFAYPDVESHKAYDVLQDLASDGSVLWRWDVTPTARTLVAGYASVTHYDRIVAADNPQAYTEGWDADATQARNRVRMQDNTGGFDRDQIAVNASDRPGAVIDQTITASTRSAPADLYTQGLDRLTWHGHSPDLLTVFLPADDVYTVHNGDLFPTAVEAGPFTLNQTRGMAVEYRLDDELDRLEVDLVPRIPVEALDA